MRLCKHGKKCSIAFILEIFLKNMRKSKTSQPCSRTNQPMRARAVAQLFYKVVYSHLLGLSDVAVSFFL